MYWPPRSCQRREQRRPARLFPGRSGRWRSTWLWEHGHGLRRFQPGDGDDALGNYVLGLVWGYLQPGEKIEDVEYRIDGADAAGREAKEPGSGRFRLACPWDDVLLAELEGWAVYSPDPTTLAAAVRAVLEREDEPEGVV